MQQSFTQQPEPHSLDLVHNRSLCEYGKALAGMAQCRPFCPRKHQGPAQSELALGCDPPGLEIDLELALSMIWA